METFEFYLDGDNGFVLVEPGQAAPAGMRRFAVPAANVEDALSRLTAEGLPSQGAATQEGAVPQLLPQLLPQPQSQSPAPLGFNTDAPPVVPQFGTQETGEHFSPDPGYAETAAGVRDLIPSIGTGLMRGVDDMVHLPQNLMQMVGGWFMGPGAREVMDWAASFNREALEENLHQPQTELGRAAANVSQFIPGAGMFGPGGGVSNSIRYGVIPGLAAEGAGQLVQGSTVEPFFRVAAALLATGGMAFHEGAGTVAGANAQGTSGPAVQIIARYLRGMNLTEAEIDAAEALIARGRALGGGNGQPVNLTWPEAIAQVTGGRVDMSALQRVIEQARGGAAPMTEYLAGRPQATRAAFGEVAETVGPLVPPREAGTLMADLAKTEIRMLQDHINGVTAPLYRAAGNDAVDAATMSGLMARPWFVEALGKVRSSTLYGADVAGLADDNVLVLDAIKKWLDDQLGQTSTVLATNAGRIYGGQIAEVRDAATAASPPYAQALDEQALLRQWMLEPMQEGLIGDISRTTNLGTQTGAAFTRNPFSGNAEEVAQAVSTLAHTNPDLLRGFVRQHLERAFNQAARGRSGGDSQFGAAGFRAAIVGNAEQARTLELAMRALPGGDDVWDGLSNLLDVFEATGMRQGAGSPTAFNEAILSELSRGGAVGEAVSLLGSPVKAMGAISRFFEDVKTGMNTARLAGIITNPDNARLFSMLANSSRVEDIVAIGAVLVNSGIIANRQGGGEEPQIPLTIPLGLQQLMDQQRRTDPAGGGLVFPQALQELMNQQAQPLQN